MSTTNDEIHHYQRKIEKYGSDSKILLHCLNKLTKLPIGVEHLQATGIGRTVNGMRKMDGAVGETARTLVNRWKNMVAAEDEKSSSNESPAEEEEAVQKNHHHTEVPQKQSKSKKVKEENTEQPSTSSRNKAPDKSHKKSSKRDKEHASSRDHEGESSRSKSKSSRKRRRSQDDDDSTGHEDEHNKASADSDDEEQDATSRSFADALGSIESTSKKSKKSSKDKDRPRSEKHSKSLTTPSQSTSSTLPAFSVPTAPTASQPALVPPLPRITDFRPQDFEISPHYKPLPSSKYPTESPPARMRTTEEALSLAMLQKGARTKVFSGNRSSGLSSVPTLFKSCIQVLQSDIERLSQSGAFTTWVPYDLIRPVLERATAVQLYQIEDNNVYLLDDTDELWKVLCQKEHKKAVRQELETWRELYLRCHEERESRLKSLTNSHKESMKKKVPVRTTKLAYVDSVVRARGMSSKTGQTAVLASMTNAKTGARPFESAHNTSNGVVAVAEVVKMAPPSSSRASSSSSSSASSSAAARKPKVAPLMQKTLKLMKNRFRR